MATGIELIAAERKRQVEIEGYSAQHDSQHKATELIYAALAYTEAARVGVANSESNLDYSPELVMMYKSDKGRNYPFGWDFKPSTDIRDLTKAGALIAAAIDRLQMGEETNGVLEKYENRFGDTIYNTDD